MVCETLVPVRTPVTSDFAVEDLAHSGGPSCWISRLVSRALGKRQ